jgi:bacillithiol synthase
MNYEELPGIPKLWIDFLHAAMPLLPGPLEMPGIHAVVDGIAKTSIPNYQLNLGANSVAIVVNFHASLFGGPIAQILKCLTAIKICEELKQQGIAASCIVWISRPPAGFSAHALQLLDRNSEIRRFALTDHEKAQCMQPGMLPQPRITEILAEIRQMGAGRFDEETLELLNDSFHSQETMSSVHAQWIASLFKEWGLIVVDSEAPEVRSAYKESHSALFNQQERIQSLIQKQRADLTQRGYEANTPDSAIPSCLIQSGMMPVAAFVADPLEIYDFAIAAPIYEALGWVQPIIRPRCSATIIHGRNRRTLDRYHLQLSQLFGGEQKAMEFVLNSINHDAVTALNRLQAEADGCLTEISACESADKKFLKIRENCRKKILYQLAKLQRHCSDAVAIKEQTAMRKIRRACHWLAPNGHLQENELGGIQIPLHYSRAGLKALYEKLDIRNLEHQIIEMD